MKREVSRETGSERSSERGRFQPAARTYVRPMAGWWRKNPWFVRYMLREGSALFLAAYALVLLAGLACLAQGEAAFDAWRAALATPWSVGLHLAALVLVTYHSITWFHVMPKTAPRLPFDPRRITWAGWAATAALSAATVALVAWVAR